MFENHKQNDRKHKSRNVTDNKHRALISYLLKINLLQKSRACVSGRARGKNARSYPWRVFQLIRCACDTWKGFIESLRCVGDLPARVHFAPMDCTPLEAGTDLGEENIGCRAQVTIWHGPPQYILIFLHNVNSYCVLCQSRKSWHKHMYIENLSVWNTLL